MDATASKTGTTRAEVEVDDTAAAAATDLPDGVGLHDLLSLGAIREALLLSSGRLPASSAGSENDDKNETSGGTSKRLTDEEARRLPLLLRLLSASRPLSSRPAIGPTNDNEEEAEDGGSAATSTPPKSSSEADQVVPLLEQVAAYHPQAELIEIILGGGGGSKSSSGGSNTSAAGSATKFIGRVPALTRKPTSTTSSNSNGLKGGHKMLSREWDTKYLKAALAGKLVGGSSAAASSKPGSKKRRVSDLMADDAADGNGEEGQNKSGKSDEIATSDDDDDDGDIAMDTTTDQAVDHLVMPPDGKRAKTGHTDTAHALPVSSSFLASAHAAAAQDTTEATVSRTLREVTTLVLASIEPPILVDLGHYMGGIEGASSAADGVTPASSVVGDEDQKDGKCKTTTASDAGGEEEAAADGEGDVGGESTRVKTAPVFIKLEPDSLLAEESFGGPTTSSDDHGEEDEEGKSKSTGALHGYGAGSELKATIASLLQHTPALRYRHVAVSMIVIDDM